MAWGGEDEALDSDGEGETVYEESEELHSARQIPQSTRRV